MPPGCCHSLELVLGRFQQVKVFAIGNLCGSGVTWKEPLQHMGAMGQ